MKLKLMALSGSKVYADKIADKLGIEAVEAEEFCFDDGECFAAPKGNVRGDDIFIIQSMHECDKESLSTKLIKSFVLCGATATASSGRTTLVAPYLCFGRQDRKTSSRAPITTKYLQRLYQAMRVDRMLAIDVHNPSAEQNAFALDIHLDLLDSRVLYHQYLLPYKKYPLTVLSPDDGGMERVTNLYKGMTKYGFDDVQVACMYKTHGKTGDREIEGHGIMGNVKDRYVVVYDDMISSGTTISQCAKFCKKEGAISILAVCAPHGLFVGKANEKLDDDFIERIVITDTIPPFRITNPKVKEKLIILPTTDLFADAIRRIHGNESISELIAGNYPI